MGAILSRPQGVKFNQVFPMGVIKSLYTLIILLVPWRCPVATAYDRLGYRLGPMTIIIHFVGNKETKTSFWRVRDGMRIALDCSTVLIDLRAKYRVLDRWCVGRIVEQSISHKAIALWDARGCDPTTLQSLNEKEALSSNFRISQSLKTMEI